ncbi:ABC transporter ATP-binding protein [Spirosoma linguale]|uniref:ABC transporter related protein n=1 Tax=Spirosoma linguale (strain ATCC 33905 / DSM 74 / LMG 10896 / Claus 1) TaxID=504472 RepID=D2QEH2_SPILD|nr:ABC transporter related protein [Spirosoma linguale DSM 74]
MYCLETKGLYYQYAQQQRILSGIDLKVPEHSIYGFLGPNGAGKTTTMRLVLGLLTSQAGEINIFGRPLAANRLAILRKIGSLIEMPSFYAHLTVTENLRILQSIYRTPVSRIQYVLDITGLNHTGAKPVGKFSLGMKQRFGIAASLLHSPELLILDEPTNGLDPNGMIEVWELLRSLNRQEGLSIFISSHLLAEIERRVTHLGIIHKGELLFQGRLDELQSQAMQYTILSTSDPERALKLVQPFDDTAFIDERQLHTKLLSADSIAAMSRLLVQHEVDLYQITTQQEDLEHLFMHLIGPNS